MNLSRLLNAAGFKANSIKFPNSWIGHIPFASWLIEQLNPAVFVELGTHTGNSYFSVCQAVYEEKLHTRCYAVDTWLGDEHAGLYGEKIYQDVVQYNSDNYHNFSILLRMTFDEASENFPEKSIDLLHIDGLHTYEAVKHDYETWLPKLSPGAIVLFHDTNVYERGFGVWRFWREVVSDHPGNIEFLHSSGLGVIQLNNYSENNKADWLYLENEEKQKLVKYFSALGSYQLNRFDIFTLQETNQNLINEINSNKRQVEKLNAETSALRKQIDSFNGQISTLRSNIAEIYQEQLIQDHKNNLVESLDRRKLIFLVGNNIFTQIGLVLNRLTFRKHREYIRFNNLVRGTGFLDSSWYTSQYLNDLSEPIDPVKHYYFIGAIEGKNPNPFFDTKWYLDNNHDVAAKDINPFLHFIEYGVSEKRNPNPYFNIEWYVSNYPDSVTNGNHPLIHYIKYGKIGKANPNPFFDTKWYLEKYIDVAINELDPLLHFICFGVEEYRNPNPYFDTKWYLETYPFVKVLGLNPLLHFIANGVTGKFNPNPYFNCAWYLKEYTDVKNFAINPLLHYMTDGWKELRKPNPYFSPKWYAYKYSDIDVTQCDPFLHYLAVGISQRRDPNPYFHSQWYCSTYDDIGESGMCPLHHYMYYGAKEGRMPNRYFDVKWYLEEYPEVKKSSIEPLAYHILYGVNAGNRMSQRFYIPSYEQFREGTHSLAPFVIKQDLREVESELRFDVILVTYNSAKWIDGCLDSLKKFTKSINIIIVDNNSSDDTIEKIRSYEADFSGLILIENNENIGFGAANNIGVKNGSAPYIFLLNIDAEIHDKTFIEKLSCHILSSKNDVVAWEARQYPFEHPKCYDPVSLETGWFSGAAVIIKRDAFLEVDGFEEKFFMYCEDVDLSWRLRYHGYRLLYCPKLVVVHHSYSHKSEIKPTAQYYGVRNNLFLRYRFGSEEDKNTGEDLFVNINKLLEKSVSSLLEANLLDIKKESKFFEKNQYHNTQNFKPFFDRFEYEIIREGSFYSWGTPKECPLVSIIIRTIGRIAYLRQAICSALNQTYRNIEILIIEDGSAHSLSLIEEFNDSRIKYKSTEKVGRCVAGNIGLEMSTGKFINLLDEDDLLYCDHIEILSNELNRDNTIDAAWGSAFKVLTEERIENREEICDRKYVLDHQENPSFEEMKIKNYFPIQSVLFNRKCFEKLGGFDPEIDLLEDWDLWLKYMKEFKFRRIEKTTSLYRVPHDNETFKKRGKRLAVYESAVKKKHNISSYVE